MKTEKWASYYDDMINCMVNNVGSIKTPQPDNWLIIKGHFEEFIKNVDELTEVYNQENKRVK